LTRVSFILQIWHEVGWRQDLHINLRFIHLLESLIERCAGENGKQLAAVARHQFSVPIGKLMGMNID
jgi:hypothetical protein